MDDGYVLLSFSLGIIGGLIMCFAVELYYDSREKKRLLKAVKEEKRRKRE